MKTTFLTIALAATTAFVLSQSPAIAKESKSAAKNTTKTATSKTHHKKHWYKP